MIYGRDTPIAFMPWVGEYGVMLMFWVRYINTVRAPYKIVCCRKGDEPYFPTANEFFYDWVDPVVDAAKNGTGWRAADSAEIFDVRDKLYNKYPNAAIMEVFRLPQRPKCYKFCNIPVDLQPVVKRDLKADIVLGCRKRAYNPHKNWIHWGTVVRAFKAAGYTVGLVGSKPTSFDIEEADVRAWQFGIDADTNANIELIKNAKVYIGTDTGTTHLASMCNTPMIVFKDNSEWEMMTFALRTNKGYSEHLEDGWVNPQSVIDSTLRYLKTQ